MKFTTLILAGSRAGQEDTVAKFAGVRCKAFAEVGDKPMINRVITALKISDNIGQIFISLPDDLSFDSDIQRIAADISPVRSLVKALEVLADDTPILVTTADHALLSADMINGFINQYNVDQFNVAVAMIPLHILRNKYPDMKRTRLRFKDGNYKSCNLFIFKDKQSAEKILTFWQKIEHHRKEPWKMLKSLGLGTLLRYFMRQLSLAQALNYLGDKTTTKIQAVILDIPEAAIDVDRPSDLEFVRSIIKKI